MKFVVRNIPLPPSINHLYWTDKKGVRHMTSEGKAYKESVGFLFLAERNMQGVVIPPPHIKLFLAVRLFLKNEQRDTDGGHKILQDSLAEALGFNDRQIRKILIDAEIDRNNPHADVLLTLK